MKRPHGAPIGEENEPETHGRDVFRRRCVPWVSTANRPTCMTQAGRPSTFKDLLGYPTLRFELCLHARQTNKVLRHRGW